VSSEHRKNGRRFPALVASHQRFVGSALQPGRIGRRRMQKGRHEAGLFFDLKLSGEAKISTSR
jgi:hypothetical protein